MKYSNKNSTCQLSDQDSLIISPFIEGKRSKCITTGLNLEGE